ncbi:MAG: hypothetical protein QW448_07140 [Thermofilaceae archaeon]
MVEVTSYLIYKFKSLMTNRSGLFWGIGFMLFWAVMWVYVFLRVEEPLPPREVLEQVLKVVSALGYSYLGVLSMASVAIGLTSYKLYSSSASAFVVRFSRLTPFRLLLEDFVSGVAAIISYTLAVVAAVTGLMYLRFNILLFPEKPVELLAYIVLAGVEWYWLSYLLCTVMLALRKPRSQLLNMLPMMIGFGIYATLWLDPGKLVYALPIAPLAPLVVSSASSIDPVAGGWIPYQPWRNPGAATVVEPLPALISTFAWILSLALASLLLAKRVTGIPMEEVG